MKVFNVQVPGKVMLCGEYSVLAGEKTLACTVDGFLNAEISSSESLELDSNLWTSNKSYAHLSQLDQHDPFESCVSSSINKDDFSPFALNVKSDLEVQYGVGSSSALRLACTHAIANHSGQHTDIWESARKSINEQRRHQKKASGYDIATQVMGGTVSYQPASQRNIGADQCQRIPDAHECLNRISTVMVGPKGSATADLVNQTLSWLERENRFQELNRCNRNLHDCFLNLFEEESEENLTKLIYRVAASRKFFRGSPSLPNWMDAANELTGLDQSWSYKTTGAGGEDAVILIGNDRKIGRRFFEEKGWKELPFQFGNQGLKGEAKVI